MTIDYHIHIFTSRIAQKAEHDLMCLYGSPHVVGVTSNVSQDRGNAP